MFYSTSNRSSLKAYWF